MGMFLFIVCLCRKIPEQSKADGHQQDAQRKPGAELETGPPGPERGDRPGVHSVSQSGISDATNMGSGSVTPPREDVDKPLSFPQGPGRLPPYFVSGVGSTPTSKPTAEKMVQARAAFCSNT